MTKSLKIVRFAALALTVVTALGMGHAYAGVASVGGELSLQRTLGIGCLPCEMIERRP